MLTLYPDSYQDQMWWVFIGLVDGALFILCHDCTPDVAYYTYRTLAHILRQTERLQ